MPIQSNLQQTLQNCRPGMDGDTNELPVAFGATRGIPGPDFGIVPLVPGVSHRNASLVDHRPAILLRLQNDKKQTPPPVSSEGSQDCCLNRPKGPGQFPAHTRHFPPTGISGNHAGRRYAPLQTGYVPIIALIGLLRKILPRTKAPDPAGQNCRFSLHKRLHWSRQIESLVLPTGILRHLMDRRRDTQYAIVTYPMKPHCRRIPESL